MKNVILAALFLASMPAFAAKTLDCRQTTKEESYPKRIKVTYDRKTVEIDGGREATYTGKFEKVNQKSGNLQYDSADLTGIADQTTFGKVFINEKQRKVTLSVQQVGDSEGQWFITGEYRCE